MSQKCSAASFDSRAAYFPIQGIQCDSCQGDDLTAYSEEVQPCNWRALVEMVEAICLTVFNAIAIFFGMTFTDTKDVACIEGSLLSTSADNLVKIDCLKYILKDPIKDPQKSFNVKPFAPQREIFEAGIKKRQNQFLELNAKYNDEARMSTSLQKGLNSLQKLCEERDDPKNGALFFQTHKIPKLEQMKPVCDFFKLRKNNEITPFYISEESHNWPCSLLGNEKNTYFLFPLCIGEGGKKSVYAGIDMDGDCVAISKIESNDPNFQHLKVPQPIFDALKSCASQSEEGGVLPFIDLIDVSNAGCEMQFLVQKLCNKGDLVDLFQSGVVLNPTEKKAFATQLFNGLISMHANGLLHKDLKLENVMIHDLESQTGCSNSKQAFLGDPDYTCFISDHEIDQDEGYANKKTRVGSLAYLAPETFIDKKYNEKSEVWNLGLILYFIFTGKLPKIVAEMQGMVSSGKINELFNPNTLYEEFELMLPWDDEEPNSAVTRLLSKMMCANPKDRYSLKEAFRVFKTIPEDQL